jgi:hypothetical protein
MFLSLLLAYFKRSRGFVWSPDLDLRDHTVRSNLIPGVQY